MRLTCIEFVAQGEVATAELGAPPEPGASEILIETTFTGVTNGTERHALLGEHGYAGGVYPSRHGYQHVGVVTAAGAAVTRYAPGDRVFYGDYVGHRGWNVADENGLLLKLPEDVDARRCALFGVAGVGLRAVRRMGVSAGDNVWVAGQGPIGHFAAQAARAVGARVTVTDMVARRLDAARAAGAHTVLDAGAWDGIAGGGPYDYVFDCCSAPGLLDEVWSRELLAHGGTIGAVAVRSRADFPWSLLHGKEARYEVSCHFGADDLRVLLWLVRQGLILMEPLVSHIVSIDEAPRVYGLLAERSEDLLGAIFDWAE